MPDDATEGVAEHSSRLQPSINLHAPVTAFSKRAITSPSDDTNNKTDSDTIFENISPTFTFILFWDEVVSDGNGVIFNLLCSGSKSSLVFFYSLTKC